MSRTLMELVFAAADAEEMGRTLKVSPEEFNLLLSTPVEEWDVLVGAISLNHEPGRGVVAEIERP